MELGKFHEEGLRSGRGKFLGVVRRVVWGRRVVETNIRHVRAQLSVTGTAAVRS